MPSGVPIFIHFGEMNEYFNSYWWKVAQDPRMILWGCQHRCVSSVDTIIPCQPWQWKTRNSQTIKDEGNWLIGGLRTQSNYAYEQHSRLGLHTVLPTWGFCNVRRKFGTCRPRLKILCGGLHVRTMFTFPILMASSARHQTRYPELGRSMHHESNYWGR